MHQPLTDKDDAAHDAFNNPDFTEIRSMPEWCRKRRSTNVYRSLNIWSDNSKDEALRGPFVIDIDNDDGKLDDALSVTRDAVKWFVGSYGLKETDMRLFFTGHKGFNIEIRHAAIPIEGSPDVQKGEEKDIMNELTKALQRGKTLTVPFGTSIFENGKWVFKTGRRNVLDYKISSVVSVDGSSIDGRVFEHEHVRLHNSINAWIEDGIKKLVGKWRSPSKTLTLWK